MFNVFRMCIVLFLFFTFSSKSYSQYRQYESSSHIDGVFSAGTGAQYGGLGFKRVVILGPSLRMSLEVQMGLGLALISNSTTTRQSVSHTAVALQLISLKQPLILYSTTRQMILIVTATTIVTG